MNIQKVFLDGKNLASNDLSSVIVRLAMTLNDISSAGLIIQLMDGEKHSNGKVSSAKEGVPLLESVLQIPSLVQGNRLYGIRMQLAHLREGVMIVKDIDDTKFNPYLTVLTVEQKQFYKLFKDLWDKTDNNNKVKGEEFVKKVGDLRHKLAFHYDNVAIQEALDMVKNLSRPAFGFMELAPVPALTRFTFADGLCENALYKHIWDVGPPNSLSNQKIGELMRWCSELCFKFYIFGRALCEAYLEQFKVSEQTASEVKYQLSLRQAVRTPEGTLEPGELLDSVEIVIPHSSQNSQQKHETVVLKSGLNTPMNSSNPTAANRKLPKQPKQGRRGKHRKP